MNEITPNAPSLEELATIKDAAFRRLTDATKAVKAIEREVAGIESRIATYLIGLGRNEEAVLNLVSEASLLVHSDELEEAIEVYNRAIEITQKQKAMEYLRGSVAELRKRIENRKSQKPLDEVLVLVENLGGTVTGSANGKTTRWVEFSLGNVNFKVDISTTYHVTTDEDQSGYEVTTIDRLGARIKEAVDKFAIQLRAEMESEEMEDEDTDDFNEV